MLLGDGLVLFEQRFDVCKVLLVPSQEDVDLNLLVELPQRLLATVGQREQAVRGPVPSFVVARREVVDQHDDHEAQDSREHEVQPGAGLRAHPCPPRPQGSDAQADCQHGDREIEHEVPCVDHALGEALHVAPHAQVGADLACRPVEDELTDAHGEQDSKHHERQHRGDDLGGCKHAHQQADSHEVGAKAEYAEVARRSGSPVDAPVLAHDPGVDERRQPQYAPHHE